jgi:hypothetical protein
MNTQCLWRSIVVSAALLLFLASPSAVYAAYTSAVVGSTATMTGDAAGDVLTITQSGGLFSHNRFTAGDPLFNSQFDFDTAVGGDQTISSTTGIININAGDGADSIALGDGIDLRGAIDGGPGIDTIDYAASTTAIRANLGLGTAGLAATVGADQEVAPTTHAGTGTATVSNYSVTAQTFDIVVTVADLPPGDVTGFHIHQAAVGVNGPIIVDFTGVAPLVPAGTGFTFTAPGLTLPTASEAAFLGGGTYVNIHTAAFPGGAIRGQLFTTGNANLAPTGAATGTTSVSNVENATGGTANDSLVGSFIANTLNGGGGADWIVGGPGADTFGGDAGADVLVWSNGDGSDVMEGGADGDTVQVNGSVAGADAFNVAANGARLDFDRTNLVPFSLDIGTTETLTVNGINGNESFTVNDLAGVASLTTLNQNGFDEDDTFTYVASSSGGVAFNAHGGPGADTLQGPNSASTWNVTAANAGNITGLVSSFRFIEALSGGTAIDTFNVRGFATGTVGVSGGGGADVLNYNAEGRVVSGDAEGPDGVIDSPGVQSVTFTGTEDVNITTLQPPANLYVSALSGNQVTFRFDAPTLGPAPTGYALEGGVVPGQILASLATGSNAPIFSVVAPTGSFFVRMHALNGAEKSVASNEIAVHVNVPVAPSTPDLFSSTVNGDAVVLAWRNTFAGGQPTGVILDVTGSAVGQIPLGLSETLSVTGVPPGTYTLRLGAVNAGGASLPSDPVVVTIPSVCLGGPEVPSNVLAYRIGNTVFVVWDPPLSGPAAASYVVSVSGSFVGSFGTTVRSLSGQAGAGSYTISVAAVNSCGSSPASAPQTVTIP